MKDCELIGNREVLNNETFYEYKSGRKTEDYARLLNTMELEAEERVDNKDFNDNENEDVFFEDSKETELKTAEDWYFTYVLNKKEILSKEEQLRLLKIYHTSNNEIEKNEARDILLETNQRLIVSIAKKCRISGVDLDDLIQEGNLGMLKAIEKYDISRNNALSTYATYWIRVYIGRYIQEHGSSIRLPVNMLERIYKFRRIVSEFQRKGEKIPSNNELAKLMNCNNKQLTKVISYSNVMEAVSLSTPLKTRKEGVGEGVELQDSIPIIEDTPADGYENVEKLKVLHKEMQEMFDERVYDILCRRYGMNEYLVPQTLKEIGKVYGISKERVRQIQERAERQLLKNKNIKTLIR